MNQDEHQRERMRAWVRAYVDSQNHGLPTGVTPEGMASRCLAEFDKRFPAPAAVEVAKAPALTTMSLDVAETILAQEAELASLRTKARYWDAVGSGKVRLTHLPDGIWHTSSGTRIGATRIGYGNTAAEAVQAAIDAGALK